MARIQFSLRTLLVAVAAVAFLTLLLAIILARQRLIMTQTVSVRLTGNGRVLFGDRDTDLSDVLTDLERWAVVLKSDGFTTRLLIELRGDVPQEDVRRMRQLGRDAGFERIETKRLVW